MTLEGKEHMVELKTQESLLRALKRAAARRLTAEELEKQRVSFIVGSLKENSAVTRARIREVLAQQEGKNVKLMLRDKVRCATPV
jgi:hypothetical protein